MGLRDEVLGIAGDGWVGDVRCMLAWCWKASLVVDWYICTDFQRSFGIEVLLHVHGAF